MQSIDQVTKVSSQFVIGDKIIDEIIQNPMAECYKCPYANNTAKIVLSIYGPSQASDHERHEVSRLNK